LDGVSVDHREILVLIDIEERSEREVADLLSLPIGTVRSRVHRARQAFLAVARRLQLPAVVFERVREGS
jgi:RNA polymerase sigma-70 factor (ECF subfamily)